MKKVLRHAVEQKDLTLVRNILIKMASRSRLSATDLEAITETMESMPDLFEKSDEPLPRPKDFAVVDEVGDVADADVAVVDETVVEVEVKAESDVPLDDMILTKEAGCSPDHRSKPVVLDEEIVIEPTSETYAGALVNYLRKHFTLPAFESLVETRVAHTI